MFYLFFYLKSAVEVFIYIVWSLFGVLYVFFDKIGVEIRRVEEKNEEGFKIFFSICFSIFNEYFHL